MQVSVRLADLTFVTQADPSANAVLWTPERPDDYAEACKLGREYGAELHMMMRATDNPSLFGAVIKALSMAGVFEGVEAGFCQYFGMHLVGIDHSIPAPVMTPRPAI